METGTINLMLKYNNKNAFIKNIGFSIIFLSINNKKI